MGFESIVDAVVVTTIVLITIQVWLKHDPYEPGSTVDSGQDAFTTYRPWQ